MRRSTAVGTLCLFALTILTLTAHASAPLLLTHQGRLLDAADQPVTGSVELTFRIFETSAGGVELWSEVHPMVSVSNGLFVTTLGSLVPLSADVLAPAGGGLPPVTIERWLEVQVAGDTPLAPRVQLVAAPYAVVASRVSGDLETQPGEFALKVVNKGNIKGNVTVNNANLVMSNEDEGGVEPSNQLTLEARKSKTYQKMTDSDIAGTRTAEMSADSSGSSVALVSDDDGDGNNERGLMAGATALVGSGGSTRLNGWNSGIGIESQFELGTEDSISTLALKHSDPDVTDSITLKVTKSGALCAGDYEYVLKSHRFALTSDSSGASCLLDVDENSDGIPERRFQTLSNASKSSSRWLADVDDDGSPDYTATQTADDLGARLAIKTKGTSAQRLGVTVGANADSSEVECTFDENNDGIAEARSIQICTESDATNETSFQSGARQLKTMARNSLEHARTLVVCDLDSDGLYETSVTQTSTDSMAGVDLRYRAGTRVFCGVADRIAQGQLECDSDADGVMDNTISQVSADSTASVTVVSRFGSGPRQTTSMDGSFSHSSHRTATDVDGDGTPESSTESYSDATTARIKAVLDNINVGSRAQLQADDSGPSLTLDEDDIIRVLVSPDSGIQQYDAAGTKTVDFDANGDGYVAGNMKFGLISGSHRIDVLGGAYCDGTNWVNASDANSKENFAKVDGRDILNKLDRLDITRWNYRGQADAAHIGPTAQDFREVFGVGSDDKSISTIDPSGIALAAIKELNRQNQELRAQNEQLQNELHDIRLAVSALQKR